jgi:CheY-like chemotaxis protein
LVWVYLEPMTTDALITPGLSSPTVLVVEDEVLIRMAVSQALRERGLAVIEACSAAEAMDVIHSGFVPDALFTDIRMPGTVDGLQLAALLESYFPTMPVFISSAYVRREDIRLGINFMPKPVDPYIAARVIEDAITRH